MGLREEVQALVVKDVWPDGNGLGFKTDPRLYYLRGTAVRGGILHATVGRNSLRYLAYGNIVEGRFVCADYLIAKDGTIYVLIPPGRACNHAGYGTWLGLRDLNRQFIGIEIENMNDGADPYTYEQYLAVAGTLAYRAALAQFDNRYITSHAAVAQYAPGEPCAGKYGRKSDPVGWDWIYFGHLLGAIRQPQNWPTTWGIPLWAPPAPARH